MKSPSSPSARSATSPARHKGKNVIDDHEHTSSVNALCILRAILREL
jgi:hypothetical protein